MEKKTEEILTEAKNFFKFYKKEIGKSIKEGKKIIYLDFSELSSFSHELAELVIDKPEETLQLLELAIEESGLVNNPRVRLINLPEPYTEKVRNLRAKHLGKMIMVEGIIRQASEVRPQVINAKFECPSCGTVLSVLQIENKFREPSRCSCGRRTGFNIISKEMVDAQRIVIEESPESLIGGEQPRRLNVFLKEDLVEPNMEEKTTPGSRILVIGVLKEIPIPSKTGGTLTRYDLATMANNIIPLEENYEDLDITEEDEKQIKELSVDPRIFEKLGESIVPSIYGYENVKQAISLQLFGGVKKTRSDGTKSRGDIHIFLVGDPGVAKSVTLKFVSGIAPKGRYIAGKSATGAGLTATVIKDEYLRGWSLEAGAMVLANKGVVCLHPNSFLWANNEIISMAELWGRGIPTKKPNRKKFFKFIPSFNFSQDKLINELMYEIIKTPYKGRLISLKLANGLNLLVTPEHKFYASGICTRHPNFKKRLNNLVLAKDLKENCYLNNLQIPFPEQAKKENYAYLFGFIYGDGYIDLGGITISQSGRNNFLIKRLTEEYPNGKIYKKKEKEKIIVSSSNGKEYKLKSKDAFFFINDRRLMINYFNNFSHLQELLNLDEESLCRFIAGVFDSDGSINHFKEKVIALRIYPTKNEKETQILICALKRIGINSIMQTYRKNLLEITISSGKDIKLFWNKIGKYSEKLSKESSPNIKFKVKYGGLKDNFIKILKIKEIEYDDFVYDINVLNNHNFIVNGVLTHNCIDEMDKMDPQDRSAMHEAMEQQCYHYDTLVSLADGSEIKIGELVENLLEKNKDKIIQGKDCLMLPTDELEVFTTDFKNIFKTKSVKVSKHRAFDKFIRIKFSHGREIIVTPEHPVFIVNDNQIVTKRADSIKIGDSVPIPLAIPLEGEEQQFNYFYKNARAKQHITIPNKNGSELFKFLGYQISEGSREFNRGKLIGLNFTNKDKRLLEDYENLMKSIFNIKPIKQVRTDENGDRFCYRYISTELANFIRETMPEILEKSGEKQIPKFAMKGRKEDIAIMISSLFEGDGYAAIKERTIRIGYKTKSKRLAEQIQNLLLRFGIRSSITENRGFFRAGITDYGNIKKFQENIGFVTPEKNNIIETYLAEKTIRRFVKNKAPLEFNEKIIEILKEESISQIGKYKIYDIIYDHEKRKPKFSFSVQFLKELLNKVNKLENKDFLEQFTGNIGWEKVSGIEIINNEEEKWVYDITIEPNHTFVSQAAILHNTVTISKANIQATLRAEASVLAAANPKFGRFDQYQTVASQIDLPPTLINRFDVIFILKDNPDRINDEAIATHVLGEHRNRAIKPPIERDLFRKYIAYAKTKIFPALTDEAMNEIKKFYVDLRNMPVSVDQPTRPLPISARQLEALVRLSEASAKTRLSDKVLIMDAQRAIGILKYYLMQVGYDYETKTFDIDRIATGVSTSQRGKIILVRETIAKLEGRLGKMIPVEELKKELHEKVDEKEIDESLEKLTISGDIFHPRKGFVQRM